MIVKKKLSIVFRDNIFKFYKFLIQNLIRHKNNFVKSKKGSKIINHILHLNNKTIASSVNIKRKKTIIEAKFINLVFSKFYKTKLYFLC